MLRTESPRPGRRAWAVLTVAAVIGLIAAALWWRLPANLGWVRLLAALMTDAGDPQALAAANTWFARSTTGGALGAGIVAALNGDTSAAWDIWQTDPPRPERLAHLGALSAGRDQVETAVVFYVGADQAADRSLYLGRFCQSHRLPDQAASVTAACQAWQDVNAGNLLVNADQGHRDTAGWQLIPSTPAARGELTIEPPSGGASTVLALTTDAPAPETNSFCQRIQLKPNERVAFSAQIFAAPAQAASPTVRVLYVGWRDRQGRSQGNQGAIITGAVPWTSYRREFQLPPAAQPSVLFCPLEVAGAGSFRVTDIRVVSISD